MTEQPITVSITRIVDPERAKEVAAWARAGQDLLSASPGYLGSGWVRPDPDSPEWHMLFRFADAASLEAWQRSPEREWWMGPPPSEWSSTHLRSAARASRGGSTSPHPSRSSRPRHPRPLGGSR